MGGATKETYSEQYVTYTLEMAGKFYLVEHVPARVCLETGEQYFAPETVEKIQKIIWGQKSRSK
ncbi:MAG: YgiT-type zinc finger protein [Syntrophales bacterium]